MKRHLYFALILCTCGLIMRAADPTETRYNDAQCQGSLRPYPIEISRVMTPDSLTPVYISHVGRHGSRYPASSASTKTIQKALLTAKEEGTITQTGLELLKVVDLVAAESENRWGALDSLGMAEQRSIASRMYQTLKPVFKNATVNALSSYSPRSMMSMYSFVHQLDRMDNNIEFVTSTGRTNSKLMRPFDVDNDYIAFRKSGIEKPIYEDFMKSVCPTSAIERVLGKDYPYESKEEKLDLAINEYYVIAGLRAMSVDIDESRFFTNEEYNALWSCFNLRQYLQRSATTLSSIPADIAADLVIDVVTKTDAFIEGTNPANVDLRFGHAETVLPFVALLRLPGCYYLTNYFDTVALHWKDFDIVPMAANVQMILFKSNTGRYYLRTDLNEIPITLIPNNQNIYVPWGMAREYMMRCVPLYAQ